jgi:uncharacterized protein YdeI (YjbR/CyaY-like superfamily)
MPFNMEKENSYYAKNKAAWRDWLTKNSNATSAVWLIIYHKISDTPSLTYEEAVEEALCFGWIDSKPNKRDPESYYLFFSKRKPKSNWSKANRERAERMIQSKQMTNKGLENGHLACIKRSTRFNTSGRFKKSIRKKYKSQSEF